MHIIKKLGLEAFWTAFLLFFLGHFCLAQDFNYLSPQPLRPLYSQPDTIVLLFAGDVMMHSEQLADAGRRGVDCFDFSTYFAAPHPGLPSVESLVQEADLALANAEFTLAGRPYSGYPCFSAPDSYASFLADRGFDVFLTANNHILDKGKSGIERTLATYSKMEEGRPLWHTGCAVNEVDDSLRNPLLVPVKGIRLAFLNFTYGTNSSLASPFPRVSRTDTAAIARAIERARRRGAEYIIALPHWGVEYSLRHSSAQEKLAIWLARKGVDAVVGSHPHVVQDCVQVPVSGEDGRIRQVPVVYSLGNLVSNMSAPDTQVGMLATLRIAIDRQGNHRLLPPSLTLTWCSRPGGLAASYATIPLKSYADKGELWTNEYDHLKMLSSYKRVKSQTGIADE